MIKYFSILLIVVGVLFIGLGGYKLQHTTRAQKVTIKEAYNILEHARKSEEKKEVSETNFRPKKNEVVGILSIPSINAELPIVEGTDEDDLEKGVGHYKGTAYPQQNDQIVLSGHRDTVFRRMGELKIGDILTVKLPYGSFSYRILKTKIVDADDRTVIRSTAPEEVLTVTTCYPFSYIGNAPNRYIITAVPISIATKK